MARYQFGRGEICPFCWITPVYPKGQRGLHWHEHWNRVGLREYISVPVLGAVGLTTSLFITPRRSGWSGPILFDEAARDALVFDSTSARGKTKTVGDLLAIASIGHPMLVDTIAVAWLGRESPDVAWQMFVINAQAYTLTVALNGIVKSLVGRERPFGRRCDDPNRSAEFDCESDSRYRAFYSGHAAITATSAGLICTHHTQLQLYKSNFLDSGTCVAAIAATAATGAFRMTSDYHWASDVLVGHAVGFISGYFLPTLLYYKEFRFTPEPPHEDPSPGPGQKPLIAVLPSFSADSLQLTAVGTF
jgi:membrane-associated phospholipid phosphatase